MNRKFNILYRLIVLIILLFAGYNSFTQPYRKGETVKDFQAKKILNYKTSSSAFSGLEGKITVLDFFGTWCLPCIKAIPNLQKLENEHKKDLSVILVSNEDEETLSSFINKQNNFSFPLIVDADSKITNAFQPSSYPYTVILDKQNKIIAITKAGSITEKNITDWLTNKKNNASGIKSSAKNSNALNTYTLQNSSNKLVRLSQEFIYAAKTGDETAQFINDLKNISYTHLKEQLNNDDAKKAFWINMYNAYTQVLLNQDTGRYTSRNKFFKSKLINIAGETFSLDDIEHGILRHSKTKWSYGYINKFFPSKREKELRVDKTDYRIHFALNCGAKSCPPIAFYNNENLNSQLNLAAKAYLQNETEYNAAKNVAAVPAIMGWFRADFGGKKGIIKILQQHNIIPLHANPGIKFKKYNWALFLNNYKK